MDLSLLLTGDVPDVVRHLRTQAALFGTETVTTEILSKIRSEALPPRVYLHWLTASRDCQATCLGLGQDSRAVRRAAIKSFGKLFCSRHPHRVWAALGDTTGIATYLSNASIEDVKHFCKQLRRAGTVEKASVDRRACVDALLYALRPVNHSGAVTKSDDRPLWNHVHGILASCSERVVSSVFDDNFDHERVVHAKSPLIAHASHFRAKCLDGLRDFSREIDMETIRALAAIKSNETAPDPDTTLSANSLFVIELLEILATRPTCEALRHRPTLDDLANLLFRRLARRRCHPRTMFRATLAYVRYSHRHPPFLPRPITILHDPGKYIIKAWGQRPDRLDDSLTKYISLCSEAGFEEIEMCLEVVKLVPRPARVRLLSMLMRRDLTTDHGLDSCGLYWNAKLLLAIDRAEARRILQRLDLTQSKYLSIFDNPDIDPGMLKISLTRGDPDLFQVAAAIVDKEKRSALRGREQSTRARHITTALRCALASHDLELYGQTLLWTRRFIKDYNALVEVYRDQTFVSYGSIDILGGFPVAKAKLASCTAQQVRAEVERSNAIVIELFQMVCQVQQEPGFRPHLWAVIASFMYHVVCWRYANINTLQDALQWSDEDVYEAVWHETVEACIKLESLGLQESNAKVHYNVLGGPLMCNPSWPAPILLEPRPATLRFVDTLAKRRDELWQSHRRNHRPAVVILDAPFPKGLPLDGLVPVDLRYVRGWYHLPYLFERVQSTVFMPSESAMAPLPTAEAAGAIGVFVDNWRTALTLYVLLSESRVKAAHTAWDHAIGPLSARLLAFEAHAFWRDLFTTLGVQGPWDEDHRASPDPRVPRGRGLEPVEWDPEANVKGNVLTSRVLQPVVLDLMLRRDSGAYNTMDSRFHTNMTAEVPDYSREPFWRRWSQATRDHRAISATTREALIAAAFLQISAVGNLSPGILAAPYPEVTGARFPALYLDGDFLDRQVGAQVPDQVWSVLTDLAEYLPSALLVRLTKALQSAPGDRDVAPRYVVRLLQILVKGDHARAALDLFREFVLNRPDDSSWHRSILNERLLNVLPRTDVCSLLQDLTDGVEEQLEQQDAEGGTGPESKPRIKITTVKMIIRLVAAYHGSTNEVPACESLIKLLARARHIDVRVCATAHLLDIYQSSKQIATHDLIIAGLRRHALPFVTGLNERAWMPHDRWMSDDFKDLPEPSLTTVDEMPPMLLCLLSSADKIGENMRSQLFANLLVPALFQSAQANARWMALFSHSLGIAFPESLVVAPACLGFLIGLLKWPAHVPLAVVELWLQVYATVLSPHPEVLKVNERLAKIPEARDSPAGQHWLAHWGPQAAQPLLSCSSPQGPARMLQQDWVSSVENGLTVERLQSVVLRQVEHILRSRDSAVSNSAWTALLHQMRPPFGRETQETWHNKVKSLMEKVSVKVQQRPSDRDAHYEADALPVDFTLRLWLLSPLMGHTLAASMENLRDFVTGVRDLIDGLAESGRGHVKRYDMLVTDLCEYGSATERVTLACMFGDTGGKTTGFDASDDMRFGLACALLRSTRADPPHMSLRETATEMLLKLAGCDDADVRAMAFGLTRDGAGKRRTGVNVAWYADSQ